MNHFPVNSPSRSRRAFLQSSLLSCAAAAGFSREPTTNPICCFNKPLQHLNYDEQARLISEMGFAGIEGTVRKGGHVEPDSVEKDLPRQIEALRECGVEMTVMTTDINNVDQEIHRSVLTTAADLGVTRFRMGSIKYTYDRPIDEQLADIRAIFQKLITFCKPLGIQPLYQNHSGAGRFGAGLWDLQEILKDVDPADAAVAFDIRHAVVEGGLSWPTEFHLIRPHFGMVYCKDFVWEQNSQKPRNVPLGTGRVDYPKFFSLLEKSHYNGPISLHMEYKDHRDPKVLPESIEAIKADLESLRKLWPA
ncbi:MAG: sugar phosphate isomerase/epimerase [Verrucomicrobiales bacterium]|nr:sugar phosphate isomerase/epimerase [Verrucomicrobiales bacterium]